MPSGARASIPAESDVLCENCGYVLNGLPPDSRCPECGKPAAESDPNLRRPTVFERAAAERAPAGGAFLSTSAAALFLPTRFYRSLATRPETPQALMFAHVYWGLSSLLLALAGYAHSAWFVFGDPRTPLNPVHWVLLALPVYAFITLTNLLAARLTHWEASYRGLRLSLPVVRRGLYYHSIHYVPVAAVAALTVLVYGHSVRHGVVDPTRATPYYLYALSGEVVLAAFYLFWTYWIGMRNMMYANA